MSNDDFEDDPLNQGGQRNWGSAEAMDDLAYLASEIEREKVGPIGLLSAAMAVIRERPIVLVACGAIAGGASYGLQISIGGPLQDLLSPIVGDKVGTALPQMIILLIVWCVGVLLQGPLTGAALEANSTREGLLPVFGRRAMEGLKPLLIISLLNMVLVVAIIASWVAAVALLVKISAAIGGFIGGLALAVGGVVSAFAALGGVLRFSLAAPAHLIEGLEPVAALKRSAELTRGTALAIAAAMFLPVGVFYFGTVALATFGAFAYQAVSVAWVLGFYIFYMMLAMAFVPAAYIVYRHYVDEIPPHKLAEDVA
jgi:hypothetical protein